MATPDASTPTLRQPPRLKVWERRERILLVAFPFVMLAVSVLLTLFVDADATTFAVAAGAALWLAAGHAPPAWRLRARYAWVGALYFTGLVALMAVLVVLSPVFGFFSWTGYIQVLTLRGRWRMVGVLAVATVTGTAQIGGVPDGSTGSIVGWAAVVLVNVGVAGTIMWLNFLDEERTTRHRRLIDELSEVNRRLETTLKENAGLQAQLVAQAREAGVLDERARMAREIHDTLAQGLTGIVTQLQAAEANGAWAPRRDAALRLARESLSEARRSVQALRPEPLEGARLPDALVDVADGWSALNGVPAEVTTTGAARPLRPEIEVTLLRTAQEGLANVAKHAHASRVGLTLSYMEDVVTLDLRDDGVGFDGRGPDGGFGLLGMRERLHGLAGTLEIESEPGAGTALSASMPAIPAGAGG